MTNLIQNAIDAIDGRAAASRDIEPGRIHVAVGQGDDDDWQLTVEDNGIGLPDDLGLRARLTEPYVTTREKGTGLGLAIVKKIMEDHGGTVGLSDREDGGTRARLVFPSRSQNGSRQTSPLLADGI